MTTFFDKFSNYLLGENNDLTTQINSTVKGDASTRLNIYRCGYANQLLDILAEDFPTIYQILGTDSFYEAGEAYLKCYPSTSYTVRDFGRYFTQFLLETAPYCDHCYLWEIANFEWTKKQVFDAPDSFIFTFADLDKIPAEDWEKATFTFISALKRQIYHYNVPQIWQAVANEQELCEPIALEKPLRWIMWRKYFNPHWYSMSESEDAFFLNASKGENFGTLCELLGEWFDDDAEISEYAASIVRGWIEDGMLASIQ